MWCGAAASTDPLDRGVPCAAENGFMLLGAPVGDIPFARQVVHHRIGKIEAVLDALPSINDAQIEFALLRHCYSLPKLTYCLRTCDSSHLLPAYDHFDSLQLSSFSLLIGRQLDAAARTQAFLPVKLGGAGLRSAVLHSSAAFIASTAQTRPIVGNLLKPEVRRRSLEQAFPSLQLHSGNATYTSADLLPPNFTQQSLSKEIDTHQHNILVNEASGRDKARLLSLSLPHAGDWLDAAPSSSLNLNFDSRSFGMAMAYRLGLKVFESGDCRADHCSRQMDEQGDHALHCQDDHGMKGGRHDRIRDLVYKEAQRASLSPTMEMPGLVPGSQSRPADVYIPSWMDGKKTAFDISVVSPTQDAIVDRAADSPAAAIDMRKASKCRLHFDQCRAQGIAFYPVVVETFGGWDSEALKLLKDLARQGARRWGKTNSEEIKYFFQRLSVSLQRGNSALLIERDVEPISV